MTTPVRTQARPLTRRHSHPFAVALALGAFLTTPILAQENASEQLNPNVSTPCEPPVQQNDVCSVLLNNNQLTSVFGFQEGVTTGRRLRRPNLKPAQILSRLDIDGDTLPDLAPDTDGDGLPDNWEIGGVEALTQSGTRIDRVVFFPAPSAIVPGTPPTPIFSRLAVATSALNPDTDGDGVSDFVEVFGLLFIDDNQNGILDSAEWSDKNDDGLPSPGEFPIDNSRSEGLRHDFDGFIFTDPTNADTDGDGAADLTQDNDPLINPRAFGLSADFIPRFDLDVQFADLDFDGLGNGMDMGNDLKRCPDSGPGGDRHCDGLGITSTFQSIDNPPNVADLIAIFRNDLSDAGVVPESAIEDLLGVDWDGNGLWRLTDVRTWHIVIDDNDVEGTDPEQLFPNLFTVGPRKLYAQQSFAELAELINNDPEYDPYAGGMARYGNPARSIGLGWQDLLLPAGKTIFLPDLRIWTILYAWRMPGFDIDGDGFVGAPTISSTARCPNLDASPDNDCGATVALRNVPTGSDPDRFILVNDAQPLNNNVDQPLDDRIAIADPLMLENPTQDRTLDGRIVAPEGFPGAQVFCGSLGMVLLAFNTLALAGMRIRRRKH